MRILYFPGLNSTGILSSPRVGNRAKLLAKICRRNGWEYFSPHGYESIESVDEGVRLVSNLADNLREPFVIVTNSFGAWLVLLYVSQNWPSYLKGVILVAPFFTVQGAVESYPPILRPLARLVARIIGTKRKAEDGVESFWVKPKMVRSMLAEHNDVFKDNRLDSLEGRPMAICFTGSSQYKPTAYNMALYEAIHCPTNTLNEDLLPDYLEKRIIEMFSA